ncbi:MAG: hypothetical protein ACI841_003092, partial [Planctomycetota bacterium]
MSQLYEGKYRSTLLGQPRIQTNQTGAPSVIVPRTSREEILGKLNTKV